MTSTETTTQGEINYLDFFAKVQEAGAQQELADALQDGVYNDANFGRIYDDWAAFINENRDVLHGTAYFDWPGPGNGLNLGDWTLTLHQGGMSFYGTDHDRDSVAFSIPSDFYHPDQRVRDAFRRDVRKRWTDQQEERDRQTHDNERSADERLYERLRIKLGKDS